ncbi:hypothetical protein BD413DRAFT_482542 [Trametes elegans]|nr:hypothetical protein BD413DRAFT_482542 [Trametes elegans]
MVRANDEAERRLQRAAERRRIPPVPDLRFEYSYVRSVAPYVHIQQAAPEGDGVQLSDKGKEKAAEGQEREGDVAHTPKEVVRVDIGSILWVTTRDQVISPLLQGALWGVAGHFLRPLGAVLGAHFRAWWARGATRSKDGSEVDGNGVQWLRNWMSSILSPPVSAVGGPSHLR